MGKRKFVVIDKKAREEHLSKRAKRLESMVERMWLCPPGLGMPGYYEHMLAGATGDSPFVPSDVMPPEPEIWIAPYYFSDLCWKIFKDRKLLPQLLLALPENPPSKARCALKKIIRYGWMAASSTDLDPKRARPITKYPVRCYNMRLLWVELQKFKRARAKQREPICL